MRGKTPSVPKIIVTPSPKYYLPDNICNDFDLILSELNAMNIET
jgi:hypothetical protein